MGRCDNWRADGFGHHHQLVRETASIDVCTLGPRLGLLLVGGLFAHTWPQGAWIN
jgi:hypothetical protein